MSNIFTNEEQLNSVVIEGFLKASEDFNKILLDAVEAGMESGRSVGVLESYNFLVREGFTEAADVLLELVQEDEKNRKLRADA